MSEPIDKIANLFEKLKTYITLQIEILSLNAGEKAAKALAKLVANGAIVFLSLFVFLFASLAMAFALSSWLNSYALGFLLTAVFYLLIALLIVLLKTKYIEEPLVDIFIKMFFNKNSEEEDERNQ